MTILTLIGSPSLFGFEPKADHFRFLATRGIDGAAVRRAVYCSAVYQSILRTSVRDPNSTTNKTVIVPDLSAARYLQKAFPGANIEKLKTEIIELEKPRTHGRPREYSSAKDRQQAYRLRQKAMHTLKISSSGLTVFPML